MGTSPIVSHLSLSRFLSNDYNYCLLYRNKKIQTTDNFQNMSITDFNRSRNYNLSLESEGSSFDSSLSQSDSRDDNLDAGEMTAPQDRPNEIQTNEVSATIF